MRRTGMRVEAAGNRTGSGRGWLLLFMPMVIV
jgi:hypothetical protein